MKTIKINKDKKKDHDNRIKVIIVLKQRFIKLSRRMISVLSRMRMSSLIKHLKLLSIHQNHKSLINTFIKMSLKMNFIMMS